MKKVIPIILIAAIFGCRSSFQIQTDTPFPGDFTSYRSYKFFNPANLPASNFSFDEGSKKVIYDAVAAELKSKGYKSIQEADLIIKIQGGINSSVETRNDNTYYPYNNYNNYNAYNSYGRNYNDYYNRPRDESKKESNIIIDIIDIKKDKIVWQGVGVGSFGKREEIDEIKLREAIIAIFSEYPYSVK